MATCGEYELEKAIGWGRHSTFFSARILGAKGPVQIVVRRARVVERAVSHTFLRAAAEQEAAVGAGCRRLAPILGYDCDETGFAYYATARYETSLAEILEAGCKVDGGQLREIVTGVLGALSELRQKSLRAHGNLTPGNILLDAGGRVFLTDLAPSAKDATTADDLFALGTLIYQLIRRTARIGMLNPPLDYSPAWTDSLGDDAEGWRELTNRLLTKSRNMGPDALKAATADVKSLASLANIAEKAAVAQVPVAGETLQPEVRRAPPKKRSPLPKVIAIILLLAGGGGGVLWWKDQEAKKKAAAVAAAEAAAKLDHDKALPETIKVLRADLKRPLPPEFDKALTALLTRIGKSLDASGNINDVTSLLGNWDLPDKMRAQAATWRTAHREWNPLAGQLEAAAQIEVEGETAIIEQLRTAIARRNAANELDSARTEVTFTLKDLDLARQTNRLLPDFEPWAVNEIGTAKNLADAPARAGSALEKLREVLKFQREKGGRVLWARFEKDAAELVRTPASGLMQGWPDRWQQAADRLIGPTDGQRTEWKNKLADAELRMAKLRPAEQAKWKAIFQEASDATADALESDVPRIDALVAKLQGMRLPIEDAKEQYNAALGRLKALTKDVADTGSKEDAQKALDKFENETKALLTKFDSETKVRLADYQKTSGTANLIPRMRAALATKDRINLQFSKPDDWEDATPAVYDLNAAIFIYKKKVPVPFLALPDMPFAMSAFETSLLLARSSGAPGSNPSDGPQIRRSDGFFPTSDWLWKGPKDIEIMGLPYLQGGVLPGDTNNDYCPATWLTFKQATDMAVALGGLLPTPEHWAAAYKRAGAVRYLRSKAWTAQVNYLPTLQKKTVTPPSGPDFGSFSKKTRLNGDDTRYVSDKNPAPTATSDEGKLWLKVVGDNSWKPTNGFTHLIGNAAEWVNNSDKPAVAGGSVVSSSLLPTDKVLPISDGAYFDVTFRLVVPLGAGGAKAGLLKFQEEARTIPDAAIPSAQ